MPNLCSWFTSNFPSDSGMFLVGGFNYKLLPRSRGQFVLIPRQVQYSDLHGTHQRRKKTGQFVTLNTPSMLRFSSVEDGLFIVNVWVVQQEVWFSHLSTSLRYHFAIVEDAVISHWQDLTDGGASKVSDWTSRTTTLTFKVANNIATALPMPSRPLVATTTSLLQSY